MFPGHYTGTSAITQSFQGFYPAANYVSGPFSFATTPQAALQIHPRPDSERAAYSAYNWAFYDGAHPMVYRRPVIARGGSPPYVFQLIQGPSWLTIGATYWQPGWTVAEAIAADYGCVLGTPNQPGSWQIWVRVWDQDHNHIDVQWTVATIAGYDATNNWGFVFLDPVNGTDPTSYPTTGVVNNFTTPIQTFNWAFGPVRNTSVTYPNAIIVTMGGTVPTWAQDPFYGIGFAAGVSPMAIIGWESSTSTVDMSLAGSNRAFSMDNNANDIFVDNVTMVNGPSAIAVATQPTGTLVNGVYTGIALTAVTGSGAGAQCAVTVSGGIVTHADTTITGPWGSGYKAGDTLSIPASAITGATSSATFTVVSTNSEESNSLSTNFSQFKSISYFNRFLLSRIYCPNVFAGTFCSDNCTMLDLDDPGNNVPRQYIWMTACTETFRQHNGGANNFGMFDWFKTQYCGADLCSTLFNAGNNAAFFQKGANSDSTIRFCMSTPPSGGSEAQACSTGNQWNGWLSGNCEICYCTLDGGPNTAKSQLFTPTINLTGNGSPSGSGGMLVTGITITGSATAGSLVVGTTYYYYFTAVLYTGEETWPINEKTYTPTTADPSVKFTFIPPENSTNIRVYRGTVSGGENVYYQLAGGATSFTDTGAPPSASGTAPTVLTSGAKAFGSYTIYRCSIRAAADISNPSGQTINGPVAFIDCSIEYDNMLQPVYVGQMTGALPAFITNTGTETQAQSGVFNNPGANDYSFAPAYAAYSGKRGALVTM